MDFYPSDLTNPDFLFDVIIAHQRRLETLEETKVNSKIPSFIDLCEKVEKSHIGILSERERLIVNRVRDIISRQ